MHAYSALSHYFTKDICEHTFGKAENGNHTCGSYVYVFIEKLKQGKEIKHTYPVLSFKWSNAYMFKFFVFIHHLKKHNCSALLHLPS